MKLLFIDETSDSNRKDYFGVCAVLIDSSHYRSIKDDVQKILSSAGWDPKIEFKGKALFSAKSGDSNIDVESRIQITERILLLNRAKKLSRISFAFCDFMSADFKSAYLKYLPELVARLLSRAPKGIGKNIISVYYDEHSSISPSEVRQVLDPVLKQRKYCLIEDVVASSSNFETVGILYADLVAYLFGRHEIHSNDLGLFRDLTPGQLSGDTRYKKLETSKKLLHTIKNLKAFEVK